MGAQPAGQGEDAGEKAQETAVASRWRTAATVLFAVGMLALGVVVVATPDVDIPFWSPVTGAVLILTALILLTTTYLTLRAKHGEDTTHTGATFSAGRTTGATRSDLT